jgi:hypothetical protein
MLRLSRNQGLRVSSLAVAFLMLGAASALAQSTCANFNNDAGRLACYDAQTEAQVAANDAAVQAETEYKRNAVGNADADGPATPEQTALLCKTIGDASESILAAREAGIPLSKTMEYTVQSMGDKIALMKPVVIEAYSLPNFSTAENKKRQAIEFRNKTEVDCYAKFP